jgi:hypothetical protein
MENGDFVVGRGGERGVGRRVVKSVDDVLDAGHD